MNEVIAFLLWALLAIIIIIAVYIVISSLLPVHAQTVTPTTPTQIYTPPQVQYAPIQLQPAGQNDYVAMIMPLIVGAGGVILAKFAKDTNDKVKKVETTTKENAAAIVDSKAVEKEIARLMFEWNKEKAEALNNSPETKLETLEANKKKAVDTASQA